MKLQEENIGESLSDIGLGNDFSDVTSEAQSIKEQIDKLDFIKILNLYSSKDTVKRVKGQATN